MARHSHSPKAPLKLGHLYALDFAEDKNYSDNWHRAGADVHMTRLLLNAYFNKLEGKTFSGIFDEIASLAKSTKTRSAKSLRINSTCPKVMIMMVFLTSICPTLWRKIRLDAYLLLYFAFFFLPTGFPLPNSI
jgi:hypothetical protein